MNATLLEEFTSIGPNRRDVDLWQSVAGKIAREPYTDGTALHLRVIGSATVDYLVEFLRVALAQRGFGAVFSTSPYGMLVQQIMQPPAQDAGISAAGVSAADVTLVMPTHRDLQHLPPVGADAAAARAGVEREVAFWLDLLSHLSGKIVLLGFDHPGERILADRCGLMPGGRLWHIRMTNLLLAERLPAHVMMVDAEALQARVGPERWPDRRLWHLCKQPYAMEALPEIAVTLSAAIAGIMGKARKVLVLDLDNTLWGGVIGDDGLDGIELGAETADGEAFLAIQSYALQLKQRGVVLAVCSKNQDTVARTPFRDHPAMVLREADIACFIANFGDKPANLREIARRLNVGLDALVFVDDNPVERMLVRREAPEVMVVDLPEDPSGYIDAIEAAQAFPMHALTREDLTRADSYRVMAATAEGQANATDLAGFLAGLQPVLHVDQVDSASAPRIAQLMAKTNQFRFNATAYDQAAILERRQDILALRLADRLQDYGIVSVAVTTLDHATLRIDNWVMSCRVFARRLEHAIVRRLVDHARVMGAARLSIAYAETSKNVILPPLLAELGFTSADGQTYTRDLDTTALAPDFMALDDHRPERTA